MILLAKSCRPTQDIVQLQRCRNVLGDTDLTDPSNNLIKHDPSDNPRGAVCKDDKLNIQTHPDPHGPT